MKKIIVLVLSVLLLCLVFVSCINDAEPDISNTLKAEDIIGTWRCELYGSDLTIEFTPDNRFISHTDGTENRYTVENGCIITYVEGDTSSEIVLEASINADTLIYGGLEYTRVEN